MRSLATILLMVSLSGVAGANGRDPFISTINFKAGDNSKIMVGATFGLLRSDDGGQTFQWFCERAVGYGGTYDPDYVYSSSGGVFATTFDGLKAMRDGCSFAATPPGMTFVTHVARGPDGAIYFSASHPTDTKIYKSTDDGTTFPTSASIPSTEDAWWQTLEVAPSNAQIVYLTGYRLPKRCTANSQNPGTPCMTNDMCIESAPDAGACEAQKEFLLYRSTDGGANFAPMGLTGIGPTSVNSAIEIAGIDPVDADRVYARVTLETPTTGESLYRSNDRRPTWTTIPTGNSNRGGLAFPVTISGSFVAGTRDIGAWKSAFVADVGCGATWEDLTTAPHVGCLYEDSAHDVWACTQNYESVQLGISSDGWGIMKSADLATWTGVLRFQDIQAPVSCAVGTTQHDRCVERYMEEQSQWCCLVPQLGLTSMAVDCTGYMACFGTRDEAVQDGTPPAKPHSGCCNAGSSAPIPLVLFVAALLFRRRRTRRCCASRCTER